MSYKCTVKMRTWDKTKGLQETTIEAHDIEELFHDLVDSPERESVNRIVIEGLDREGRHTKLSLEVTSLIKN